MEQDKLIQWYPGHMKKADRQIREKRKLIDTVIEVLDARAPLASRNPDIKDYTTHKNHIVILNKADLADPKQTEKWRTRLLAEGVDAVLPYVATDISGRKKLISLIRSLNPKEKTVLRCLIVGIPNVGKSTVINSLLGRKKAQIGNKPGVTKGQQWLQAPEDITLLDTPGILWPKFEDQRIGMELAWLGSIKDTLFEPENIAGELMKYLLETYPEELKDAYGIEVDPNAPAWMAFDALAEKRKFLLKGGEYDYARTARLLLNDFKNGRIGRITVDPAENV